MQLIDKLLNQATKTGGGGSSGASSAGSKGSKAGAKPSGGDALDEILEKSVEQSNSVVKRIDELLQLAKQRQQQQQQQRRQQQQRQQQRQQGKGQRDRRRPDRRMQQETEMMRRQQNKDGKKQQQSKAKNGKPDDPHASDDRGKREKGKDRQYPPGSKYEKALQQGRWGELPRYLQVLFRAGGRPKLPAKYKRHREEFHRRADRGNKKRK